MINSSIGKIYVFCPYGLVTGGSEALHQLVFYINKQIKDKAVLIMYKVSGVNRSGEIEWCGRQIWIPNIKLPANVVYYNIDDYESDEDDEE